MDARHHLGWKPHSHSISRRDGDCPPPNGAVPESGVQEDPCLNSLRVLTSVLQAQLDSLRPVRDSVWALEQLEQ